MEPALKRSRSKEGASEFVDTLAEMDDIVGQERRPPVPPFNPLTDDIIFQQMELDHYNDRHLEGMDGMLISDVLSILTERRADGQCANHCHVRRD